MFILMPAGFLYRASRILSLPVNRNILPLSVLMTFIFVPVPVVQLSIVFIFLFVSSDERHKAFELALGVLWVLFQHLPRLFPAVVFGQRDMRTERIHVGNGTHSQILCTLDRDAQKYGHKQGKLEIPK